MDSASIAAERGVMSPGRTRRIGASAPAGGCGLLLDINNVFVSCTDHRRDPRAWLADFPTDAVERFTWAGTRPSRCLRDRC